MTIKFSIPLAESQQLLIKSGQKVDFKTPLLKKAYQNEVKIPLAQILEIPSDKIFIHLIKLVGEEIKKGEVIAKKKIFLAEKKYVSSYDGVIKEINHEEGYLLIAVSSKKQETVNCYFKGELTEVKKNEVTLKVDNAKVFDLKEVSADFGGETLLIQPKDIINLEQQNIANKVVFVEQIQSYNQVKMEVMGARGFVTLHELVEKTSLPHSQVKNVSDWKATYNLTYAYCLINKKGSTIYLYK